MEDELLQVCLVSVFKYQYNSFLICMDCFWIWLKFYKFNNLLLT